MTTLRYALPLVLAALPAAAQTPSEALARLMMDACVFDSVTPSVDEALLTESGFDSAGVGDGTASYAAPSGATLDYATRDDFASCELRLPGIGEDGFAPLAMALAAEIGTRYGSAEERDDAGASVAEGEADDPSIAGAAGGALEGVIAGQDEDGFEWPFTAQDGAITRALLALGPDGAAVLTSATERQVSQ